MHPTVRQSSALGGFTSKRYLDSFISKMEANSGVKFKEAQVALARLWMGPNANEDGVDPITEIFIKEPVPSGEGIVETEETKLKGDKVKLPASDEEARETVERFERGASNIRGDEEVADNVAQHRFNDSTRLLDEKWLGTPEEEKDA
jgi:phospholipase D1/2